MVCEINAFATLGATDSFMACLHKVRCGVLTFIQNGILYKTNTVLKNVTLDPDKK